MVIELKMVRDQSRLGKLKEIHDRTIDKDTLFEIPIDYVLKTLKENE